jgi:hypothetical protein
MMKRLVPVIAVLVAALGAGQSLASAPEVMSYQGVLVRDNGIAVPNGTYSLRFRLFDHPTAAGTIVFEQTISTQVTNGLYNVILSNQNGFDLGDVVLQNAQLFMEVTVLNAPPSGQNIVLLPRQQLASVPYALAAEVPATPPPPPPVPALMDADHKVHTNPNNNDSNNSTDWISVTALEGVTLDVSRPDCLLEVQAEIVVSATSNGRAVGVQIEQSVNGGAGYTLVRGPVAVTAGNQPSTATLSYVVSDPATNTYLYRVRTKEDDNQVYIVSPKIGTGAGALNTQSMLSAKLWCP